jgi:hypothetical protein
MDAGPVKEQSKGSLGKFAMQAGDKFLLPLRADHGHDIQFVHRRRIIHLVDASKMRGI